MVSAACGSDHTLALDVEGRVWAFGRGEHGQCFGEHTRPFTAAPTVSAALTNLHAGESKGESKFSYLPSSKTPGGAGRSRDTHGTDAQITQIFSATP